MFPGSHYRFLNAFLEERVGFLDFPGLELPEGPLSKAPDLISRVARSVDVRAAFYKVGPELNPKTIKLADYAKARRTQKRARLAQALISFFEIAKHGDYVVLPEPLTNGQIRIGRITSDKVTEGYYPPRYGKWSIPARSINWLGGVPENTVSRDLSLSLRHQHPFTVLEKSRYVEVLSLVHGSFIYGDRHSSMIYNEAGDFLDADAALLGAISRLAAAACRSIDEGKGELGAADLVDVLLRSPPIEYTCAQEADIHSPGFNRYVSATVVALVIAALVGGLIGLSQYSSIDKLSDDVAKLTIINSAPNADPLCTAKVSEATRRVLLTLPADQTWALCEAAREAQRRAGVRSSARPSPAPEPAPPPAPLPKAAPKR
jgi:hypothetical protein